MNFSHGDYIVRQGTSGDTFYIISEGQVRITRRVEGKCLNIDYKIIIKYMKALHNILTNRRQFKESFVMLFEDKNNFVVSHIIIS